MSRDIIFSIIITSFNRLEELKFSLIKLRPYISRHDTECIVCDDGSIDGTFQFIKSNYPSIRIIRNMERRGLIYSRNKLLELAVGFYAVSLDDDLNFLTINSFEIINTFFQQHPRCAVQSFRIYWNKEVPRSTYSNSKSYRVRGFAGGAHAFRMSAWKEIPDYPEWFQFYGEENFASFHLFNCGWDIYYQPQILTHHRVNLKNRIKDKDYILRMRRSLRSGWYLYMIFYPMQYIPRALGYSIFVQLKSVVLTYNWKRLLAIIRASFDLILNLPKSIRASSRLTTDDYRNYIKLPAVPLYWKEEQP